MRRIALFAALAALSLTACTVDPPTSPGAVAVVADASGAPAPVTIADRTTLDETGALAFETAVATVADLATLAVRTKVVPTSQLAKLRERVTWARIAVGGVRGAYDSGNADSYAAAVKVATKAIADVRALASGDVR